MPCIAVADDHTEPRFPTMPKRRTSGSHRPTRQAGIARAVWEAKREVVGESLDERTACY